jgi:hypothetical protein
MRTSPTSHRLTATTLNCDLAITRLRYENIGRPAQHRPPRPGRHRMTRATRREWRASQKRAGRIRVRRPLQPVWLRMAQAAATWVF